MALQLEVSSDIEYAVNTKYRVHHHPPQGLCGMQRLELQQAVDRRPHIGQVVKHIAHARLNQIGHDIAVARSDWF